eukprot:tig00021432_g21213.t1
MVGRAAFHVAKHAPKLLPKALRYLLHPNAALRSARFFWLSKDSRDFASHVKERKVHLGFLLTAAQLLSDIGFASSLHINGLDLAFRVYRVAIFIPDGARPVLEHARQSYARFKSHTHQLQEAVLELPQVHRRGEMHAGHVVAPGQKIFEMLCHLQDDFVDAAAIAVRMALLHWGHVLIEWHRLREMSRMAADGLHARLEHTTAPIAFSPAAPAPSPSSALRPTTARLWPASPPSSSGAAQGRGCGAACAGARRHGFLPRAPPAAAASKSARSRRILPRRPS